MILSSRLLPLLLAAWMPGAASAANYYLDTSDPAGSSSLTTGGRWKDGNGTTVSGDPSAGNDYFVKSGALIRTPTGTPVSVVFQGDSLTLGEGADKQTVRLAFKTPTVVTVNRLIMDNGELANSDTNSSPDNATFSGAIELLAGGGIFHAGNEETTGRGNRTLTVDAPVSGVGGLRFTGSYHSSTTEYVLVKGTSPNTYTGGTTIDGGVVLLGKEAAFGAATNSLALTNSGTSGLITRLDLKGFGLEVGALSGVTGALITNTGTSATFRVGSGTLADAVYSYQGTISGSVALEKTGAGEQILSGAHTYTGATTVKAGKLTVDGSLTSATTVRDGATLGGSGSLGEVTVNAGGLLQSGNATTGSGSLTLGQLTLDAGSEVKLTLADASFYNAVSVSGGLQYGGTLSLTFLGGLENDDVLHLFTGSGEWNGDFESIVATGAYNGTFTYAPGSGFSLLSGGQRLTWDAGTGELRVLQMAAVPEPGSFLLGGCAALWVWWHQRRRKRHKSL